MSRTNWEHASQIATVVATVLTVGGLGFTAYQFRAAQQEHRETVDLEVETKACEMFIKYTELMRDAARRGEPEGSGAAIWRHTVSVALAEFIFDLETDDPAWIATVKWMLTTEDRVEKLVDLDCSTYSAEFMAFAASAVNHRCALHEGTTGTIRGDNRSNASRDANPQSA